MNRTMTYFKGCHNCSDVPSFSPHERRLARLSAHVITLCARAAQYSARPFAFDPGE